MTTTDLLIKHLQNASEKIELQSFTLPENYSSLINQLEQLALGLDTAFNNLTLNHQALDIAFGSDSRSATDEFFNAPPPPRPIIAGDHARNHDMSDEVQFTRVVSDIWIGVILTLLIVSVIFFICSCFLYHKFQQWKNSYRTNHNATDICRRYPTDFEAESLPSYTIVSGLPTYDDALEEFRKAGIILTPPIPVIKIFESETKNANVFNIEDLLNEGSVEGNDSTIAGGENLSMSSTCSCGKGSVDGSCSTIMNNGSCPNNCHPKRPNASMMSLCLPNSGSPTTQIIELTPEQLANLSRKRLSLQIAFNRGSLRRHSRRRIDLYRTAHRNNHLRRAGLETFTSIHRSSSSQSLAVAQNRIEQHRGSLC